MEYDTTNTGILTKNDKGTNEKRPDYRGFLNVNGVEFELSGWVRKRKADGRPFLSLNVQPARPKTVPAKDTPPPATAAPTPATPATPPAVPTSAMPEPQPAVDADDLPF